MAERRARNTISRNRALAARAADLLDDGLTDGQVYARLRKEFPGELFSARTVGSFRKADYAKVAAERLERREAAREVEMIISAARGSGASFAEAGMDLLAKAFYDVIKVRGKTLDNETAKVMGNSLGKVLTLEVERRKVAVAEAKMELAKKAEQVAGDENLSSDERRAKMREVFGMQ